ncbi:MAG TPA: iron-sulfur cluster repair di-iron protein [Pyrinomonadaceae bacterium]|nr:iron-sulfur cluster repair di-iron protein [Pyrinomonadaceae bacterium]
MTLNAMKTVRETALEMPNATRIFGKLRIDFCCGGGRPLGEACAAAGVALEEVERMFEAERTRLEGPGVDYRGLSMTELIRHILDTHHVYVREEVERITGLLGKVTSKHGENHPELWAVADAFGRLAADLAPHMFKEEEILFPYLLRLEAAVSQGEPPPFAPFGTVNNPIRMMFTEHDGAGELLREIRLAAADFRAPEDACMSFRALYGALEAFEADLHQHVHLENNVLFPRAVETEESAYAAA